MIQGNLNLCFGTTVGKTFKVDPETFSDDSTAISMRIKTKGYYPSGPDIISYIQYLFIYADDPQETSVGLYLDNENYKPLGSIEESPQRMDIWDKGYKIALEFDEVSSVNVKLKGFDVFFEPQPELL